MSTELGKAYVQVIPSAKGIKGSMENLLSGESASAGQSAGKLLGGNLASVFVKAIAAAGIGKAISATLMEGADLQQSIGGIETLFKDDAAKVKKYADEAYRTAGLSANDYMETVTGFSASLLQSLGNDTSAAGDIANMALIDMADNANKMGSSMESIQDAYQGFAKQNYTMLDNLKLGYGGTKTEMERLLKDAQALSGVEYDIDNLADVYNAIHVIQEEMDITGTTAKEAAETFSGSLASMKASLSNVMGNLALGEDLKPSLKALADSTATFVFGNLIPMLGNIVSSLPGAIVTFVQAAIPHIVKAGSDLMNLFKTSIMSVIPDSLKPLTKQFSGLGKAAEKGLSRVMDVVQDIWGTFSSIFSEIDWSGIGNGLKVALDYAINFIKPWTDAVGNYINILLDVFEGLWDGIKQGLSGDWSGALEIFKSTIVNGITGFAENILTAFSGIWENVKSLMSSIDWGGTAQMLISALGSAIVGAVSFLGDISIAIREWILGKISEVDWANVGSSIASGISSAISAALELILTIGTSIRDWIFNALNADDWLSVGTKIGDFIIAAISALVDFGTTIVAALWGFITGAFSENSTDSGNSIGSTIVDAIVAGVTALAETIAGIAFSIWDWVSSAFAEIDWASLGGDIVAGIKAGIAGAWDGFKTWVGEKAASIKGWFANPLGINSPSTVMRDEIGKWIPAGVGVGIEGGLPYITSAISDMTKTFSGIKGPTLDLSDFHDIELMDLNRMVDFPTFKSGSLSFSQPQTTNFDMTRTNELLEKLYQKNPNLVADDGSILARYTNMMDRENGIIARNKNERRL